MKIPLAPPVDAILDSSSLPKKEGLFSSHALIIASRRLGLARPRECSRPHIQAAGCEPVEGRYFVLRHRQCAAASSNSRGRTMHCNIVHDIYNFNGATVCAAKRHTRSTISQEWNSRLTSSDGKPRLHTETLGPQVVP